MKTKDSFGKWTEEYQKEAKINSELGWPSETLIRLFKGSYIPGLDKNYQGKKLLEVGFGNANNMQFLATLGFKLAGTEVSETICQIATKKLSAKGYSVDLKVGTNRSLPFPDHYFDFLVSWNVIHYESNEKHMREAIAEHARVMKPGARFFLSTTGPKHKILEGSQKIGDHLYQIGRSDDFRQGEVFFYFDAPDYIRSYFGEYFKDILVGRTHDFMMTETLDWWIATGVKK